MYITWRGEVISCAQERYIIGDLNKSCISSIWNGKPFVRLRRDTYKKGLDGLCKDCPIFDNRPETYILSRINSRLYAKRLNK
jgi:radical SAM protein with 4Fe4S-binding SPASM domain